MRNAWACVLAGAMAAVGGCSSALDEDSGTDSAEIGKCEPKFELSGDVLTPKEVARLLREAGVAEAEVPKMVCIAKYESRFFSEAHRLNENCTHDYGLFQINSHWWSKACDATAEELMDPATNARCAKIVRERDVNHFSAWHAYRSHKHECDTYKIPD